MRLNNLTPYRGESKRGVAPLPNPSPSLIIGRGIKGEGYPIKTER